MIVPNQQLLELNRKLGLRGAQSGRSVDFRNMRDERINSC
jgi:hypothetical protein